MSIAHLEDLPLPEFIKAVQNISTMHASEKLDGANLWMGLDGEGKLFTSREGKSKRSARFFNESEYPKFAAYNGFRSAHAALQAKYEDIKRIMQPEQMVELEILYGRQPNAVTYGADDKSYIAFLRGVEGTPNVISDQLEMSLGGQTVQVEVEIIETSDGENLDVTSRQITYQFTGAQKIDPSKLKDIDLKKHLDELESFLKEPAGLEGTEMTNNDLLTTSLGSVKADIRPQAKELKAQLLATIMTDFKLPVKRELLDNYVSKIKPALGAKDLTGDEDLGIEGVVLRDPTTGNLIKLVDKDAFTTINAFNHAIRNQISNVTKTFDPAAPLEARGGIVGVMKTSIADLLGNVELARGATAKKAFEKAKGATPVDTVKNFAKNLDITDFLGTKRKMLALIQQAAKDMRSMLQDFMEHKDEYQLKLKNGKVIGISPEIEKRTLLVFAESRRNIVELFDKIKVAKTIAQVIATMYGHLAKAVHETDDADDDAPPTQMEAKEVDVVRLDELKYDTDKARYAGKDAWTVINIYMATLLMSCMMYKANDKKGIRILKDKSNYKLTRWDKDMSPLNFWGYVVWRASTPAVKKLIGNKTAAGIYKIARRAAPTHSRFLHMDLSFGKDAPIEWGDHLKTIRILQQFDGLNTERINTLINGVFHYEGLTYDQKVKTIAKLYFYVTQFIPASPLFIRLKAIQDELLLNANGENDQMVQELKLLSNINSLVEDETADAAIAAQTASSSVVDTATRAKDANATDGTSIKTNKHRTVVKRRRNPDVKKAKFPKPDDSAV